jgi:uncharacterized protein YehS (DUF1456 family)
VTNSDIIRSLRYLLNTHNTKMAEICKLAGANVRDTDLFFYMKEEEDPEYKPCPDEILAHFMDGLIIYKRGQDDSRPRPPLELPITNNQVLKKLKVAFQLKEEDMLKLITASGLTFSKSELSGLMRAKDHRNYRPAGDQVLRHFLKGLTAHLKAN